MTYTIEQCIEELLKTVEKLKQINPKKKFTLDGRLVGDIGETLVAAAYEVEIIEGNKAVHDGKSSDNRLVQIKATMKNSLTFPHEPIPDFYIGIKINDRGEFFEIFNGRGITAAEAVKNRSKPKNSNLHSVNINTLIYLSKKVPPTDKIPLRKNGLIKPKPIEELEAA